MQDAMSSSVKDSWLRWPLRILLTWLSLELIGVLILLLAVGPLIRGRPASSGYAWTVIMVGLVASLVAAIPVGAKLTSLIVGRNNRVQLIVLVLAVILAIALFPSPFYFGGP